jgi:hypothetical protein
MRRWVSLIVTLALVALPGFSVAAATPAFANPAFQTQWQQGEAITPNFWGPAITGGVTEQYLYSGTNKTRLVQYFDKGRMELYGGVTNTPKVQVTNGLLATEMIKGQIQIADDQFQPMPPPAIPIAGDPDNPGPTYATLATTPGGQGMLAPARNLGGNRVSAGLGPNGEQAGGVLPANPGTLLAIYDAPTQHNVTQAFADYRLKAGLATIGYAISEPFAAMVKVAGTQRQVIVQVFERRVLTYTADNPDAFKVEMGNIGQHYAKWRYPGGVPGTATVPSGTTPPAAGTYPGKIVFETSSRQMQGEIYLMNPDGSGKTKVTTGTTPLFAPDGSRIVYFVTVLSAPNGSPFAQGIIRTANLDGTEPKDVGENGANAYVTFVRWSPDGRYLTINGTQNGPGTIGLFDFTTGKSSELRYTQGQASLVYDWTPDGRNALWQASLNYSDAKELYYGDPTRGGEGAVPLTNGQNRYTLSPSYPGSYYTAARFSPDGRTVAIAGSTLFFLAVPGQQSPLAGKTMDGLGNIVSLAWSPDGRALAIAARDSSTDGTGTISIVDIATGRVTSLGSAGLRLDWSRQ